MENRRSKQRVQGSLTAWYRFDRSNFRRSAVLDVSETGARMRSFDALPDTDVHVTIRVADEHLTYIARKAWQRREGDAYVVGLRFIESPAVDSGRLNRWVRRQVQLRELSAAS